MSESPAPPKPPGPTPFELLGGEARVLELVEKFYDAMEAHEPALARVHRLDEHGRIEATVRQRFGLFLVGWLGGPQTYQERHGHPRLRMRHAPVKVDSAMRDAWLRSMTRAMDELAISGEVRTFLDGRFAEVADFLRNHPDAMKPA